MAASASVQSKILCTREAQHGKWDQPSAAQDVAGSSPSLQQLHPEQQASESIKGSRKQKLKDAKTEIKTLKQENKIVSLRWKLAKRFLKLKGSPLAKPAQQHQQPSVWLQFSSQLGGFVRSLAVSGPASSRARAQDRGALRVCRRQLRLQQPIHAQRRGPT